MTPSSHQPQAIRKMPAAASTSLLGSSATRKPWNSTVQGNSCRQLNSRGSTLSSAIIAPLLPPGPTAGNRPGPAVAQRQGGHYMRAAAGGQGAAGQRKGRG